jgi:regulator of protease activity HflC (stomatin/prohibitin superfamily)
VQQIDLVIETKTLDAVFVTIGLALQYKVVKVDAWNAYYRLTDPSKQIEAVVFDVVRSTVPRMELDEVFASKSDIAAEIQRKIEYIHQFGYEIVDTLLTCISPVALVKDAMNAMNSAKRSKDAMPHRAEGEKIAKVKGAEAAAEKAHLHGVGVAKARTAIASSLKESLQKLDIKESGIIAPKNIMDLLLISHYYDTLSALGAERVILHHNPQEIGELEAQISTYFAEPQATIAPLPDHGLIPDLLS